MSAETYFVVQQIYSGWALLGFVLAAQLFGLIAVIWLYRVEPRVLWPALTALACLVAARAIFWIYTYPANEATENWTQQPANWQALRAQWEYSHLAGAAFQTAAMAALVVAVLRRFEPAAPSEKSRATVDRPNSPSATG